MELTREQIISGKYCPYCLGRSQLVDSAIIYSGKSYGKIYLCGQCDAHVGLHKGTSKSLGRLANADLRFWKRRAHECFDPIWGKLIEKGVSRRKARAAAYEWLSRKMELPIEDTHIGYFDVAECQKVIDLCGMFRENVKSK